jgi:hypothetical protein
MPGLASAVALDEVSSDSLTVELLRGLLERESTQTGEYVRHLSATLVAWYTFFFGFVFAAVAWSITRCFDVAGKVTTYRPLYIVGTFCFVQTVLGMLVAYRCHQGLDRLRKRDQQIIGALRRPVPALTPQSAIPEAYTQGIWLMVCALVSILASIVIMFILSRFNLL